MFFFLIRVNKQFVNILIEKQCRNQIEQLLDFECDYFLVSCNFSCILRSNTSNESALSFDGFFVGGSTGSSQNVAPMELSADYLEFKFFFSHEIHESHSIMRDSYLNQNTSHGKRHAGLQN